MLTSSLLLSFLASGLCYAQSIALDRRPDLLQSLSVPAGNTAEVQDKTPVTGPWSLVYTVDGVRTWEAPLPVRPRVLFFHRAPDDMVVFQRTGASADWVNTVSHRGWNGLDDSDSWAFTSDSLQVRRPIGAGAPQPWEYAIRYSAAQDREESLNHHHSGLSDRDFVFRSLQLGSTTRHGLFLPSPARVEFVLDLEENSVLDFSLAILPPEVADSTKNSDGATLKISVVSSSGTELLDEIHPQLGQFESHRVDLGSYADQRVTLVLDSDPLEDSSFDYIFVADPVVHVPDAQPPRIVMIFIDTLRPDHMSVYGYDRPTTPKLDAWAEDAAIFEQARSIAPWTLPSARTMVTGVHPEWWGQVGTLQGALASEGWATGFFAGNIYLSSNFEMALDWGEHRCVNSPMAEEQINHALNFLSEHPDRAVLLQVHLMDMHLGYTEPRRYRYLFAGDAPPELPDEIFIRNDVLRAARQMGESGMQYVRDRYDNNLRYIDDELARLFEVLDEEDTVLVLSDHGEEFWDHGDFEHGHTLYDELLRIPMILRSPGINSGRYEVPVSMLDVAPTLAQAGGVVLNDAQGWPLQSLVDGSREAEFVARPQAFGRPLYGNRAWGSLSGNTKYISRAGKEYQFELGDDPLEQTNLFEDRQAATAAMAAALDTDVSVVWRLTASRSQQQNDLIATLHVPGGIENAWVGEDPTRKSASTVSWDGEVLTVTWEGGKRGTREIFVLPRAPVVDVSGSLSMTVATGNHEATAAFREPLATPDGRGRVLMQASVNNRTVKVRYAVVPQPYQGASGINAMSAESCAALLALGYVDTCDE